MPAQRFIIADANGEFKVTFSKADLSPSEIAEYLKTPWPPFELMRIEDIISPKQVPYYHNSTVSCAIRG